jgi:hypothetical protein
MKKFLTNSKNLFKKISYGTVKSVGSIKGIGYMPVDNYYIEETTYLFGKVLKNKRFYDYDKYVNRSKQDERTVVTGFNKNIVK